MIREAVAVVVREWQVQRRYPISMVNLVLFTPLYRLALPTLLLGATFTVGGTSLGLSRMTGTTDLAGWIGLGVLSASLLVGAVTSVFSTLDADRSTGVIEHSWCSPAPREAYVVGAVLTGSMFASAASLVLLAFAVIGLGASLSALGSLLSLPVLAVMIVGNCGFGYLVAAALLAMRRAEALVEVTAMVAMLFSGVSFPLTLLPGVSRWPTYLLPGTWGLDLTRHLTMNTLPLVPLPVEVIALVLTSTGWLLVGRRVFIRTERRLRVTGSLAQF
ncbi:ABC transporter permease [Micromonospora sp. NPDC049044]|uniref:ABC transporter permease n=1 Tax=unclassified Micromonospora TaxID=2617518 RepID=UPI0033E516BB